MRWLFFGCWCVCAGYAYAREMDPVYMQPRGVLQNDTPASFKNTVYVRGPLPKKTKIVVVAPSVPEAPVEAVVEPAHIPPPAASPVVEAVPAPAEPVQAPKSEAPVVVGAETAVVEPAVPVERVDSDFLRAGQTQLISRFSHVGIGLGASIEGNRVYAWVVPNVSWYWKELLVSLQVPLRLHAYGIVGKKPQLGSFKVLREDWSHRSHYAKVIRSISYGHPSDPFYMNVSAVHPMTLGYGMLINRYQPSIDPARSLTGAQVHLQSKYGDVSMMVSDIMFGSRVLGAGASLRPLAYVDGLASNTYASSWSLGLEFAGDFDAPGCVLRNQPGIAGECVRGEGQSGGRDLGTGALLDRSFVRTNENTGLYHTTPRTVSAWGAVTDIRLVSTEKAWLKWYGGWHTFSNNGGGMGASTGLMADIQVGAQNIHQFRMRAEYRSFGDGFVPSYFNTVYQTGRFEYGAEKQNAQVTPTKTQSVFGDTANGFKRPSQPWRHGWRADASYTFFNQNHTRKRFGIALGAEDSTGNHDSTLYAHMEVPVVGWLQFFGTYMYSNGESLWDVLKGKNAFDEHAMVLAGLRLRIYQLVFINLQYARSLQTVRSAGAEYHLGNAHVPVPEGGTVFKRDSLFEAKHLLSAQLELGWEFFSW